MSRLNLEHVHIVGIGGAGTSALAQLLLQQEISVSGSDRTPTAITERLIDLGVDVRYNESWDNVPENTSLLVYSAAVKEDHPERDQATKLGIEQKKYAEVVGMLSELRQTIAVAGTHGKTSTTNIIANLLSRARKRPSWLIGGEPTSLPTAAKWDRGTTFVVEACEYDHSFLNLTPASVVLHNIEADHMDYFGSMDNLLKAFRDLTETLGPRGVVFANWDDENVREVARKSSRRVIRYGFDEDATYRPENIELVNGCAHFSFMKGKRELCEMQLAIPGEINVMNALAAATVASWIGIDPEFIAESISEVTGVKRRFERVGEFASVPVIDDYAHHPTALRELVKSARGVFKDHWLTFVFQAHQYGRLLRNFDDFAEALTGLDEVLICRTYAARESGVMPGEPEERLARELRSRGTVALALSSFEGVMNHLRSGWRPDKAILVVGAGDVTDIAHRLVEEGGIRSGRYDRSGIPRGG